MLDPQIADQIWPYVNQAVEWVGFAVVVGLLAKAILPGRDPGGVVATIVIGSIGAVIGCGGLMYILDDRVSPMTAHGFAAATTGAFVLLLSHRLLSGGTVFRSAADLTAGTSASDEKPQKRFRRAA